jgi:hypothetical protein
LKNGLSHRAGHGVIGPRTAYLSNDYLVILKVQQLTR